MRMAKGSSVKDQTRDVRMACAATRALLGSYLASPSRLTMKLMFG